MAEQNGNLAEQLPEEPLPAEIEEEGKVGYGKKTDELLAKKGETKGYTIKNYEGAAKQAEWIQAFEESAGVGLSEDIRDQIAMALIDSNRPREQALFDLKRELLKEKPEANVPAGEVIDEMLDYYKETAKAFAKVDIDVLNVKTVGEFRQIMEESFTPFVKAYSQKLKESEKEEFGTTLFESIKINDAIKKIREVFDKIDEQVKTGVIEENYAELQQKIDNLVAIYGFDKSIFEGSVKRYLDLSGVDVSKIEFYDTIAKHSKTSEEPSEE